MILHVNIIVRNFDDATALSRRIEIGYRHFGYGKGGFEETLEQFTDHFLPDTSWCLEQYYPSFNMITLKEKICLRMETVGYSPIGWQRFLPERQAGVWVYSERLMYSSARLKDQMEENKEWCKEKWIEPFLVYS